MNIDNLVSVAAIINDDASSIESFVEDLSTVLRANYANYEIVLIDNGSTDDSVNRVREIQKHHKSIRLIVLSKKYEDEITYFAAIGNCIGDFVVLIDINYDPPALIPDLINKALSGYDIVVAERHGKETRSLFDKATSRVFFKLSRFLTGYNVSPRLSKYIVFSRRAVNSLIKIKDRSRYIKFLIMEVGFSYCTVPYEHINRGGKIKKENYFQAFAFAAEVLVSNSEKLIRIASFTGLLASMLNLLYAFYVLIGFSFFRSKIMAGWTSTQLVHAFMSFLVFFILAIIGEYIARILRETKKGELYYISEEHNSSVFPGNIERKNVI